MKVKPMIGEYEVPGIQRIGTIEDRRVVEIPVPGLAGSYHQDLGSGAVSLRIEGTLAGDDARDDFLGKVREMYNAGDPVDFVADIVTATHVEKVLMTDLAVAEVAGTADTFRYAIVLAQHVEPPPPSPGADQGFGDLSDVNAAVAAEAGARPGRRAAQPEGPDAAPQGDAGRRQVRRRRAVVRRWQAQGTLRVGRACRRSPTP